MGFSKKGLKVLLLLVLLVSVAAVAFAAKKYHEVDTAGVKKMVDAGDALLVFPLSPVEYDHLHIKDSVNIPMGQLEEQLPKDKNKSIVFYCLGLKCVASWRAAEKAVALGYTNVYAYREGLPAWVKAGYPTVSTAKLPDVEIKKISTGDLAGLLDSQDITLVDINLDEDAHKFYIDHSKRVHIPLDELNASLPQIPKDKKVVVICLKGKRSPAAVRYLIGKGYQDVVMVNGGVQKWVLEGRPVQQAG